MLGQSAISEAPISTLPAVCLCCVPQTTPCCDCLATARTWLLQVTGITNGDCSTGRCDDYNGLFVLVEFPTVGSCFWISNLDGNPCGGSFATWQMTCNQIIANGSAGFAIARYLLVGTWQCLSQNTFTLVESDGTCLNYPSQLTLQPLSI